MNTSKIVKTKKFSIDVLRLVVLQGPHMDRSTSKQLNSDTKTGNGHSHDPLSLRARGGGDKFLLPGPL